MDLDELVEHWTLLPDEASLLRNKTGATRVGFALLLKHFIRHCRFPQGREDFAEETVEFVARQVSVPAAELGLYDWHGRQIKRHRVEIRRHLGFRECSTSDADKLAAWLAAEVCEAERAHGRIREELLARCKFERIEPPAPGRVERIIRSALHTAEKRLTVRVADRLPAEVVVRLRALVDLGVDGAGDAVDTDVLSLIKSVPGNVSLESMLTEIRKLRAVRAIGLPERLFADVAPKVVATWRGRAAVEAPSHLRTHPDSVMLTLVAA